MNSETTLVSRMIIVRKLNRIRGFLHPENQFHTERSEKPWRSFLGSLAGLAPLARCHGRSIAAILRRSSAAVASALRRGYGS